MCIQQPPRRHPSFLIAWHFQTVTYNSSFAAMLFCLDKTLVILSIQSVTLKWLTVHTYWLFGITITSNSKQQTQMCLQCKMMTMPINQTWFLVRWFQVEVRPCLRRATHTSCVLHHWTLVVVVTKYLILYQLLAILTRREDGNLLRILIIWYALDPPTLVLQRTHTVLLILVIWYALDPPTLVLQRTHTVLLILIIWYALDPPTLVLQRTHTVLLILVIWYALGPPTLVLQCTHALLLIHGLSIQLMSM